MHSRNDVSLLVSELPRTNTNFVLEWTTTLMYVQKPLFFPLANGTVIIITEEPMQYVHMERIYLLSQQFHRTCVVHP